MNQGHFRVGGKGGTNDRGGEGVKKDGVGASMHV